MPRAGGPPIRSQGTYKKRGLVDTITEPSAQATILGYDSRGRLNARTDGVTGGTPAAYTYDANGNLLTHVEGTKTITRGYDTLNRLTSYAYADTANPAHGYTLGFLYDNNGNLTRVTYPGTKAVNYVYDSNNRLTTVTDWAGRVTTYVYDLAGRVKEVQRPNGTKRKVTYNAAGEVTQVEELVTATGAWLNLHRYGYDTGGRLQHEFIAPVPAPYAEPAQAVAHNADNQITTFAGQPVVHDPDGNMTSGPLTTATPVVYSYDTRNRLMGVGGVSYTYDPEGNRLTQTQAGQTTRYVVNGAAQLSQVLVRVRPDGTQTFYVYGHGLLYDVDTDAAGTETGPRRHYHADYRGSTVAVTDAGATVTERIEYNAYGLVTRRAGTLTDTPFLFNGQYGVMSDASGLYCMRARYYNPLLRRFVNADPIGLAGGMNFFAYADGNPAVEIDPTGLQSYTMPFRMNAALNRFVEMQQQPVEINDVASGALHYLVGGGKRAVFGPELVKSMQMIQVVTPFEITDTSINRTAYQDWSFASVPLDVLNVGLTVGQFRYINDGVTTYTTDNVYAFPFINIDHNTGGVSRHNFLLAALVRVVTLGGLIGEPYPFNGSWQTLPSPKPGGG